MVPSEQQLFFLIRGGQHTPPPPPFIFLLGIEEDGTFVMFAPRVATNYGSALGKKKKKF